MNGDALRPSLKYVYYLINVPKISGDVILGNRYCSVVTEAGAALSVN